MSASNEQALLLENPDLENGTDEENWKEGEVPGKAGCRSDIYRKLITSITSSDIYTKVHASIRGLAGGRAFMLVTTVIMFTDQYLDGGVAVALENDIFKSLAMLLVLSIVLPQVIAWAFLLQNGMADYASLLRILLFPIMGLSTLMCLDLAAVPEANFLKDAALFSTAISLEPLWHLRKGWVNGREVEESFWSTVCEGLMEAPASAGFTLYPAMLKSVHSHMGPSPLFIVSSVWSLVMVTRASTKLHFYGTQPSSMEYAKKMILMKFPQVISQVIGLVAFAFLTRPLPQGIRDHDKFSETAFNDEIGGKSISRFVFAFVALEIVMNFATLRTISPKMGMSIAALFATTMVVGSPPGFLRALDGARLGHALQHLMIMVVMATVGVGVASEAHWEVLVQEYPFFGAMFLVSVPWAFVASVLWKNEMSVEERLKLAQKQLAKAISSNDHMMIRLLVDVEGVDILPRFYQALESQQPQVCNVLVKALPEVRDHFKSELEEAVRQEDVCLTKKLVLGAPALAIQLDEAARQRVRDLFPSKSNPLEAVHQLLDARWDITGQKFSNVASMITLFIHCPDGQQGCGGGYLLQVEQMVNGMPLWRRAGSGAERWLYSGTDGRWHIGDQEERENNFDCTSSWISSEAAHDGHLPPDMQSWKHSDSGKVVQFSSPGLKITTEFPAHPAVLLVHATDSQDQEHEYFGGEYRLHMEQMANGMPLWRRAGNMGVEFWLYSNTNGAWTFCDKNAKEQDFNCALGCIKSKDAHGGLFPPDMHSWQRSDKTGLVPIQLKVTTEVPAYPAFLSVQSPDGQPECAAGYWLEKELMANGMPLWRKAGMGAERWLYSGTNGKWFIGGSAEKERGFSCSVGFVQSDADHLGLLPPSMRSWKLCCRDKDAGYAEDTIVVTGAGSEVVNGTYKRVPGLVDSCTQGDHHYIQKGGNHRIFCYKAYRGHPMGWHIACDGLNSMYFAPGGSDSIPLTGWVVFREDKTPGSAPPPKLTSQVEQHCCPGDHVMTQFSTTESGYHCSVCEAAFEKGTILWSCRVCDFDTCQGCLAKKVRPTVGDIVTVGSRRGKIIKDYGDKDAYKVKFFDNDETLDRYFTEGEVRVRQAEDVVIADPAVLFIKCPDGQQQCGGEYQLQTEQMANDMPLWRRAGMGVELWLYSSTSGKWFIGGSGAKEKDFKCSVGFIHSEAEHGGLFPLDMQSWKWWDGSKKEWFPCPGLEMTTKAPPAHPAAIFVHTPDGQKASAGEYRLHSEQMAATEGDTLVLKCENAVEESTRCGRGIYFDVANKSPNHVLVEGLVAGLDGNEAQRATAYACTAGASTRSETVPGRWEELWAGTLQGKKTSTDVLFQKPVALKPGETRGFFLHSENGSILYSDPGKGCANDDLSIAPGKWMKNAEPFAECQEDGLYNTHAGAVKYRFEAKKERIEGIWCYGETGNYSLRGEPEGTLRFHEQLSGGTTSGLLRRFGDWYEGRLFMDHTEWGTIRLRLDVACAQVVSNFMKPEDTVWGRDIVAHKTAEAQGATEMMANGMPLWRRAGMGEERWLYSGTDGTWHMFCQDAKAKNFNCAIGYIKSGDTHCGLFPPDMQSWKWFDGKEWVPSPDLKVTTMVPEYPAALFVHTPDGQKTSAGEYQLQKGQMANGMPLWRRAGMGEERWLYSGTDGIWDIFCQDAKDKNFNCAIGYIKSGDTHGGLLPPDMQSWKWYDGAELVPSPGLKVTTKVPAYPTILYVQSPEGQPECVGKYLLDEEQMCNGMPLWVKAGTGAERWLYSGTCGRWLIGGKEKGLHCWVDWIHSEAQHGGLLPPRMESWKWWDSDKKEWLASPSLNISTERLPRS